MLDRIWSIVAQLAILLLPMAVFVLWLRRAGADKAPFAPARRATRIVEALIVLLLGFTLLVFAAFEVERNTSVFTTFPMGVALGTALMAATIVASSFLAFRGRTHAGLTGSAALFIVLTAIPNGPEFPRPHAHSTEVDPAKAYITLDVGGVIRHR